MTTKVSCRCSTASSTSEKLRAASVAEMSFTESDYQIGRVPLGIGRPGTKVASRSDTAGTSLHELCDTEIGIGKAPVSGRVRGQIALEIGRRVALLAHP
jgi:hypothetical protein